MLKYERNLNHCYVIFVGNEGMVDELAINMLRENRISGLLPAKITRNNAATEVAYEISRFQNMEKAFESQRIRNEQIMNLLKTLVLLLEELEGYYLDSAGLVLNPVNIYWNEDFSEVNFCYNPVEEQRCNHEMSDLSELILKRADYGDYKSVVYAYELFQAVKEENFSLQAIIDKLEEVGKNHYIPIEQEKPVVADNYMTASEYAETEYVEVESEMDKEAAIPKVDEKNNKQAVIQEMSKLFDEDEEDDWEKEEPSGRLFGLPKRKKNKKGRNKKSEASEQEDFMEESFFYAGNEETSVESNVFSAKKIDICSINSVSGDFNVENFPFLIGSLQYAVDGCIDDSSISRFHARFDQNMGKVYLSDLNSASGTFLNDIRLTGSVQKEIKPGDRVKFGALEFIINERS